MLWLTKRKHSCAAADGLLLQPLSQRNQPSSSPPVKIDYKTHAITPDLHHDTHDQSSEGLEAHGLLGIMTAFRPSLSLSDFSYQVS